MDPLEITKDLIKIDTRNPPGVTTEAVEYLSQLFSSYEQRIYAKEEGKENLVVYISRGKPEIMLTSHLDTVPAGDELLNPVIVDGKLYGRGSCDAKGCVAAICSASQIEPECGLKLAFTSDEEVGGVNGLGYVFEREKADAVIIGEPTGSESIGVLQAAVLALDIEFKGNSGHTASHDAKEGAIYRASEYIVEKVESFRGLEGDFGSYREIFSKLGMDFAVKSWHAVFNPSMIRGGVKRNVVAPKCTVYADVRFAPWISVEEVRRELYAENMEFRVEGFLQPYGVGCDAVKLEDDLRLLKIMSEAIREEGLRPKAVFSLGVGDTRHVRKHGVPAFYLGPGGGNLHGEDEFVYVEELYRTAKIYKNIVRRF
ncbi:MULTISPECIES: M20 family metallopeptidase [Archaeoglobus]|jgi:succinyl-diaminopimelate desuccinylase|uniref:Succinyl-diaminopimelate desuccinylase (DapE-1) n=3 Tax=Archaeoglobus fulgidus TaxID=2234 RepID=O30185_ARCFU|nr:MULTISPECIES: M20 family metallopeptidase [Archaeoglobus]AAB91180.1 succinyl-diaminopimelate desuccinylase (dapE-1) [Archaeoglobus fulgidus DSM 4304]AIG96891.1 Acetylornithine deacetylase/Succinyl-diaminopimelate desuccinylase [Archaeoglobus fulgidus DSM 8774]KUJ94596.1 MAG: Succinyl-diaminopimelate desuccinylase (DapE-1) [Archaeoglobus fulgidus]KUK07500.1 MAG: Succinyl-diaminopimelate desuccinylase (DapE-1) [Archaeoglobus fulgidus]MDI3497078.1 succinyl-diaminopimelate desuccinylase [Archae